VRTRIPVVVEFVAIGVGSVAVAIAFVPPRPFFLVPLVGLAIYLVVSRCQLWLLRRRFPMTIVRSHSLAAPPEQVWSLLSSAEAWALRPGSHAFDVPAGAGLPPLRVVTRIVSRAGSRRATGDAYELTETPAARGPGGTLIMRSAGWPESKAPTYTIRVSPQGSATRASITVRQRVALGSFSRVRAGARRNLAAWLRECEAALAGRRDRPDQTVPPDVLAALAAPLNGETTFEASFSTVIAADPARVWAAIWDPATGLALSEGKIVAAGFVPGTPIGRVGEIQYHIHPSRQPDRGMTAHLHYSRDFEPGRMIQGHMTGPGLNCDMLHLVEPEPGGTRLTHTHRYTDPSLRKVKEKARAAMRANLEKEAARQKVLIEGLAGTERPGDPPQA
jgi:polyketide cyclase/dehydrase/lipid transport protein